MKKTVLSILITVSILNFAHSTVSAGFIKETEAETTPAVTETQAETPADTVPEETTAATEAPTETTPEVTTEVTTEATTEAVETVDESKTQDPTVLTIGTESASGVTETINKDIEIYTTKAPESDKPVPKPETKKDPRVMIAIIFMFIGLALGVAGGTFLGWYLHKRKVNMEHDELFQAIKYGEVHEVVVKDKAEKDAAKKQELEKKRSERKQQAEKTKAERAAQKAEAERQRKLQQYKQMQQELGLAPLENEPEVEEQPKEEKPALLDRAINFLEKQRDKQKEKEDRKEGQDENGSGTSELPAKEEIVYHPETPVDLQEQPQSKPQPEEEFIREEDMEYGGDWHGEKYYYDPKDPEGMPFKIVNGKKEFFD